MRSSGVRAALVASLVLVLSLLVAPAVLAPAPATAETAPVPVAHAAPGDPDLGPHTFVFDPSMPVEPRSSRLVDAVAAQQVDNQFGTQRYALLFKPGTYGSAGHPLNFQVGYYTEVAGSAVTPAR